MENVIYKVKMLSEWTDAVKKDGVIHEAGDILETTDPARVTNIIVRNLGELVGTSIEEALQKMVEFESKEYPLDQVHSALLAIGEKMQGNIGVAGISKRIAELSPEQLEALRAALEENGGNDEDRV